MLLDDVILQILKREGAAVADQEGLLQRLKQRGFDVNQSTLSRHLKKLGIVKQSGRYVVANQQAAMAKVSGVQLVVAPPNLILLRTLPAHAHALGYRIDELEIPQIAGTVAGDDTLMIAVTPPDALHLVKNKLETFLETLT